jgi:large subunit ribosomal protein L4
MKIPVYNQNAEVVGDITISPAIFEVKLSVHLLAEAVRIQQSNARKGLANTKNRGQVSGGGKKPWKQKGTGRARAGSTRGPIWRHGGVSFGPTSDRNWELKMNKKAKTKALFMSLSEKARDGKFIVVDSMTLATPKTKEFVKMLSGFRSKVEGFGKKQIFLMPKKDDILSRVSRNIPGMNPTLASSLNVYDVLNADTMVVLKDSLPVIEKTYLRVAKSVKPASVTSAKK